MSSAEHLTKCKEVLTTDQGVQDFSYHLEQNCFVWKKKILTDMKIKFGQVDIEKVGTTNYKWLEINLIKKRENENVKLLIEFSNNRYLL